MRPIRALVVDDEPLARQRIVELLAAEPDVEVAGECATGAEAIRRVSEHRPDVLLLDVQMPDVDGFEVLHALRHTVLPLVIFISAYEHFALRAFDVHAVDYVLKPVDAERFRRAVARARAALRGEATSAPRQRLLALLDDLSARRSVVRRIVLRSGGRILFLDPETVDRIEAAGNHVRVVAGAQVYVARETLSAMEARLDPSRFLRLSRSVIVNIDRIVELQPWFQGDFVVVLRGGARVTTGPAYRHRVHALLGRGE